MKILVCETNQLAVGVVGGVVKLFLILSTHFAVWTAVAVKQVLVLRSFSFSMVRELTR